MMTAEFILDEKDNTVRVSQGQAMDILVEHDARSDEFYADCGKHDSYPWHVVLAWLGY